MKNILIKILLLILFFFLSTGMISENKLSIISKYSSDNISIELLYDNIWGSIYNPVKEQCNNDPTITGDGSKINPKKASEHRWIAISQNMLNCNYRQNLLAFDRTDLYKGKIQYGDTVWIDSPHAEINGKWVVRDSKNVRYTNSIDFLQTTGDGSLYNNNPNWSGKFENIKIYKINGIRKNS